MLIINKYIANEIVIKTMGIAYARNNMSLLPISSPLLWLHIILKVLEIRNETYLK